jgi:predicted kinase
MNTENKVKLYLYRGIPASGKTTFAKQQLKKDNEVSLTTVRVNRDDIRKTLFNIPNYGNIEENLVTQIEDTTIITALCKKLNVIIDATNIDTIRLASKVTELITRACFETPELYIIIIERFFPITLEEAIKRDKEREVSVGEEVVTKFYNRLFANKSLNNLIPEVKVEGEVNMSDFCISILENNKESKKKSQIPYTSRQDNYNQFKL